MEFAIPIDVYEFRSELSTTLAFCKMEFAIPIDVDEFSSELSTTLAFWKNGIRNPY